MRGKQALRSQLGRDVRGCEGDKNPRLAVCLAIASLWVQLPSGLGIVCFSAASNAGLFPAVGSARAGVAVTAGIDSGTSVWSKSGGGGPAELGCCFLTLSGCPPATGLVHSSHSLVRHDHWEMSIDAQLCSRGTLSQQE